MPSISSKLSEFIYNNYKGVTVVPNALVSYVKQLSGKDLRHSFVCIQKKESKTVCITKTSPKSPRTAEEVDEELNLTGSPLKDDFKIEVINVSLGNESRPYLQPWSTIEESYHGLNVNTAKAIINDIGMECDSITNANGPVWILCDRAEEDVLLLENQFDTEWWIRGVVKAMGPVPIESIRMEDLIQTHLKRYSGVQDFATEIESIYQLKDNIHVKVETRFAKATYPSFSYFQDARITLKQYLPKQQDDFLALNFWYDILTLNYIKKYILDYNKSSKNDPEYDCGTGIKLRDLKEEIANLFTTVIFSPVLKEDQENSNVTDINAIVESAKSRDYTDITDNLWNLLKCCGSYQDLKMAFNYMFHFVQTNNIVNIPSNKNNVARLILDLSQGCLANLCLAETEPLELLLEIGLEKVEKDYEYIFTKSKITTLQDMKSSSEFNKEHITIKSDGMIRKSVFHSNKNKKIDSSDGTNRTTLLLRKCSTIDDQQEDTFHHSDFDENEVEMKVCKLAHYHGILEHLLLLKTVFYNVDVFGSVMEHMLQQPMHYPFRIVQDRGFKDLDMEVLNNALLRLVKDSPPNMRRTQFSSVTNCLELKTVFIHSLNSIFPGQDVINANVSAPSTNNGDTEALDEPERIQSYFNYLYLHTRSKV